MVVGRYKSLFYKVTLLGILTLLQHGCSPTFYVKLSPSIDISSIKSIGIWFPSEISAPNSRDIVTKAFEEAFSENGFVLIENNKLTKVIKLTTGITRGQALGVEILSPDALKRIRSETGADAFLLGELSSSPCSPFVSYHSCRLECYLKLIDVRSGEIIMDGRLMEESMTLRDASLQIARRVVSKLK